MTAMAWWTLFLILLIWRVSRHFFSLARCCQTAAANSGNSIFLPNNLVGYWSVEWRLLLVPMAGGAAYTALSVVLDRVLADGGSEGRGGPVRAAL